MPCRKTFSSFPSDISPCLKENRMTTSTPLASPVWKAIWKPRTKIIAEWVAHVTVMKFRILVAMEKIHLLGLLKTVKLTLCSPTLGRWGRGVCLFVYLFCLPPPDLWYACLHWKSLKKVYRSITALESRRLTAEQAEWSTKLDLDPRLHQSFG